MSTLLYDINPHISATPPYAGANSQQDLTSLQVLHEIQITHEHNCAAAVVCREQCPKECSLQQARLNDCLQDRTGESHRQEGLGGSSRCSTRGILALSRIHQFTCHRGAPDDG